MPRRPAPPIRPLAPRAPRRRPDAPGGAELSRRLAAVRLGQAALSLHPLSDNAANAALQNYDRSVKDAFDRIVPVLKRLSALQHEDDFVQRAQALAEAELGFSLPLPILEKAWVSQLDMRSLFAWCVFETYEQTSDGFFRDDPLRGQPGSQAAEDFNAFLLSCGFHLLDVTPCADGRLAHAIAFALRLPFSSVRRRPHAGALFDVENTVNRWVKTEHRRYREGVPNPAHDDTRYLKVVLYHFSSLDPTHEGCAAHGSDDALAASCGRARLMEFQQAVENSFCCGASVDLLLLGIDTDTDAIRVHVPGMDGSTRLDQWLDAATVYEATRHLHPEEARRRIAELTEAAAASTPDPGMVRLIARLLEHNISQIDYVRQYHGGHYADAGHAERFIGVGIGFKEIHLRNLTYFAYMDTVEEGAPDMDVGVKIFKGLNVSRGLPVPVVVRFDYNGKVPGARERAVRHAQRVQEAIENRYPDLFSQGLLHALLTVRDQERHTPAEAVGSTISLATAGGH
ncbi:MAG: carboxysome shell carbonic anhydrase [Cyanobium sp. CZS 25K]|nr:carboxysome shell carbonic anhydrase [Cyanobium sp. CZS25K]